MRLCRHRHEIKSYLTGGRGYETQLPLAHLIASEQILYSVCVRHS